MHSAQLVEYIAQLLPFATKTHAVVPTHDTLARAGPAAVPE